MKKIISILLLFCFTNMAGYAVNFDTSVDEKIRQNYDVEANDDLPALPSFVPTSKERKYFIQPSPLTCNIPSYPHCREGQI